MTKATEHAHMSNYTISGFVKGLSNPVYKMLKMEIR